MKLKCKSTSLLPDLGRRWREASDEGWRSLYLYYLGMLNIKNYKINENSNKSKSFCRQILFSNLYFKISSDVPLNIAFELSVFSQ